MLFEIFTVPLSDGDQVLEAMNRFIASHKVVSVDRQCVASGDKSCWTFCVCYLQEVPAVETGNRRGDVDYRGVLAPEAFTRFTILRQCRKQIAFSKSMPVYAVFTNAELAALAQMPELDPSALSSVKGIGKQRIQKYGLSLLKLYREMSSAPVASAEPESSPAPDEPLFTDGEEDH